MKMQLIRHRWGWVVMALVIFMSPQLVWAADDDVQRLTVENQQLRAQVEQLTAELETLRQELAALRQDHTELTEETQVLEQQATEMQAKAVLKTTDHALVAQAERIKVEYDEKADHTQVVFGPEQVVAEGSPGDFYFSIVYSHAGADPAAVDVATLFLQNYRSGRLFDQSEVVTFEFNDETMALPIASVDVTPRKGGLLGRTRTDRSDEIVTLKLDRETLIQLGEARTLTIHEGRTVVTFDQDDLAAMRAMALRMRAE